MKNPTKIHQKYIMSTRHRHAVLPVTHCADYATPQATSLSIAQRRIEVDARAPRVTMRLMSGVRTVGATHLLAGDDERPVVFVVIETSLAIFLLQTLHGTLLLKILAMLFAEVLVKQLLFAVGSSAAEKTRQRSTSIWDARENVSLARVLYC